LLEATLSLLDFRKCFIHLPNRLLKKAFGFFFLAST